MMKPHRVQLSRKKGWRMPPNTVNVARPSKWGNRYDIGGLPTLHIDGEVYDVPDAATAVRLFREEQEYWTRERPDLMDGAYEPLRGKNLACWCKLDQPCHADVLLEFANRCPPATQSCYPLLPYWKMMKHIDDWLDDPATGPADAKEWLEHFRRPAIDHNHKWLAERKLFCTYKDGKRYRCIGCSRMGDVWLTKHFEREHGYDLRIDIDDCTDWEVVSNIDSAP